jgi:hypothetical protein
MVPQACHPDHKETMSNINNILNKVHELGQPEQRPLARLGSTRLWGIACTALEATSLLFIPWHVGTAVADCSAKSFKSLMDEVFPNSQIFKNAEDPTKSIQTLKKSCILAAKMIAGFASTIFFGIIFCPELNFRIHLQLELAVDNFSVKKHKELQAKLTAEMHAKEIAEARTERFAAFEAKRDTIWAVERERPMIDARLADLILQ